MVALIKALGSKVIIDYDKDAIEYFSYIKDLLDTDIVTKMNNFRHHYSTTCLQHCINVSYYSYKICKKLHLDCRSAARAGILHDLFLYDWRERHRQKGELPHGFNHPKIALKNAKENFELNKREEDMILKHMWPLTPALPRYKETFVIMLVDKYAAILELSMYLYKKYFSYAK